jgi:hypothetical protein
VGVQWRGGKKRDGRDCVLIPAVPQAAGLFEQGGAGAAVAAGDAGWRRVVPLVVGARLVDEGWYTDVCLWAICPLLFLLSAARGDNTCHLSDRVPFKSPLFRRPLLTWLLIPGCERAFVQRVRRGGVYRMAL